MEIIMNLNKVSQEFRTLVAGECFYYDEELYMKISFDEAFNFNENAIHKFDKNERVEWVKSKLLIG